MADLSYIEQAKEYLDYADREYAISHNADALLDAQMATAFAAIAQAEALDRIAAATERRNKLLSEYNQATKTAQDEHTAAMNAGIKKMLDAFYGPDEA